MKLKIWGVRGSIATPERRNDRYGGNTACVEVRLDNGALLVLDCGTGFRALGNALVRQSKGQPIHAHILLSHFHWDHIQGIPFFQPLYQEQNIFAFHSIQRGESALQDMLEGQMANPYFPVNVGSMRAKRGYFDLDYGSIDLNGALITSAPLNHPQGCAGFRIEAEGAVLVYATDNEPGSAIHDRSLRDLALNADVLIYDAQYTPEQLQNEKRGWGHSSWLEGTRIARECGVKRLILFHHDPDNADEAIDGLVRDAREHFEAVEGGAEGMAISLPDQGTSLAQEFSTLRHEPRYHIEVPVLVAWQGSHGERRETQALARNVSKSGIYFVVANSVPLERPMELELVLPEELTQKGNMKVRFAAQPIRQDKNSGSHCGNSKSVGVAALRLSPDPPSRAPKRAHMVA